MANIKEIIQNPYKNSNLIKNVPSCLMIGRCPFTSNRPTCENCHLCRSSLEVRK